MICVLALSCSQTPQKTAEDPRIAQGRAMYEAGRYDAAEKHFASLLAMADTTRDALLLAQCFKWLGNVQQAYKRPEEALGRYTRSLRLLDSLILGCDSLQSAACTSARDERSNVLNNVAVIRRERGEFDAADSLHRLVLAYDEQRGEALPVAVSLNNLGIIANRRAVGLRQQGDSASAEGELDRARGLFVRSLDSYETADAYLNLGNNCLFRARYDSAVRAYGKARALYEEQGFRMQEAICLGNIGVLLFDMKRFDEAVDALRRGIDIIERLRGNLTSIDVRSSFISNKYYLYEHLIAILVQSGSVEEAFEYVERAKARSLLDMLGNKAVGEDKVRSPEVAALVDEERALQAQITLVVENPDSAEVLIGLLEQHSDVLEKLRRADPEYASVKSIEPVSAPALQAMLGDSTALVEYYLGEHYSFVFVVRRDSLFARPLKQHPSFGLETNIETLRRQLYAGFPAQKNAVLREARLVKRLPAAEADSIWRGTATDASWQITLMRLHQALFAPVQPLLAGVRRLYIVPHGYLHHLPFHALVPFGGIDKNATAHIPRPRFLIEDYTIAYLPSASVLPFARMRSGHGEATGLVVGDPAYADPVYRKKPLDGALLEADSVARFLARATVLKREMAEESAVKESIGRQAVVHFATHGELNKKEPLRSRILLAARSPQGLNDGNLTVAEVFNLDLSASLVTLSACQTAQVAGEEGKFTQGDELVGLARSFLYAGTPAVIASLWYVDDAATLAWMNAFYRSWLFEHHPTAEAARNAALQLLARPGDADWIHPYYWGAFIFVGDMR